MSPTARSLGKLRADGWLVDVVEKWIPGINIRKDMMGAWDLVAIKDGAVSFIQVTTKANMNSRIKKILAHPDLKIMQRCGAGLFVHGWHKVKGKWVCEVREIT